MFQLCVEVQIIAVLLFVTGEPLFCSDTDHLYGCRSHACPLHFKCPLNYCIPVRLVCDGVHDCPDSEDEIGCDVIKCPGD